MKRYLLVMAAMAPAAVFAQARLDPLRYDYVTANLVLPEIDEIGIELEGSTAVTERLVVFGGYAGYEPRNGVEIETLRIGVGHTFTIRPNVDFMASISYADNDIDTPLGPADDEEGAILGAQMRGWASRRIELSGTLWLDNSRGSSTESFFDLGLQYFSDMHLSYGGRLRVGEGDSAVFIGGRFYFGASRRPL